MLRGVFNSCGLSFVNAWFVLSNLAAPWLRTTGVDRRSFLPIEHVHSVFIRSWNVWEVTQYYLVIVRIVRHLSVQRESALTLHLQDHDKDVFSFHNKNKDFQLRMC